ncbi:MAG: PAS domain-containing protein [Planctomycetota bacterium]|jgi:PAS domain S-box-containing protein
MQTMDNIIASKKRIEQGLRYLKMIAEQANEGIAIIDTGGILRFANTAWATMHGFAARDDVLGKPISAFHTSEQMKSDVIPVIFEALRRGRLEGPIEHARKDGTSFATDTKMVAVRDETGRAGGLVVFATDVTRHKRAELELAAANEQLQQEIVNHRQAQVELEECFNSVEEQIMDLTAQLTAPTGEIPPEIPQHEQELNILTESDAQSEAGKDPDFDVQVIKEAADIAKRLA